VTADAKTLFPHEDVTRDGCSIHAWSEDRAMLYLRVLIEEGVRLSQHVSEVQ